METMETFKIGYDTRPRKLVKVKFFKSGKFNGLL